MTPTKPAPLSGQFILRGQAAGFSVLLALLWIVELARVPHLLLGEAAEFNWPRVLIRSAIVLFIWLIVHVTTRRLLQRLHELEEFLLLCAWCRRVGHEGRWLHFEEFFGSRFAATTSHGICPECACQLLVPDSDPASPGGGGRPPPPRAMRRGGPPTLPPEPR